MRKACPGEWGTWVLLETIRGTGCITTSITITTPPGDSQGIEQPVSHNAEVAESQMGTDHLPLFYLRLVRGSPSDACLGLPRAMAAGAIGKGSCAP